MNKFQNIFDAQKALFASGVTRTYDWRVEQLDRMARMIGENEERFQKAMAKDFKTASQEYIFETQASAGGTGGPKRPLKRGVEAGGGKEPNTELLKLPFDFIFFTGSTVVGKIVAKAAAENLTPVLLELGGMNPAVVDATANVPDAAKKIVWGKMAWGGQWCTSPGYAYVHESVAEAFVAEARKALVELFGKDPKFNSDYSRIINGRAVERLASLIDPAKVIAGGKSDPDAHYLDPTLLYPVTWEDKSMKDEIFGPILPILTYKSLDEAFKRIAATPRPLAGYIFSRDQKTIDRFIGQLSFGGGGVNVVNVYLFVETMPFGGTGAAGMGHYYGKDGFDAPTHAKSMLISPPDVAIEHLYSPFTDEKNKALKGWFEY